MNAGKLNRRIEILAPTTSQDDYGQPVSTFAPLRTCWASIRIATSREVYAASGFVSELSHVISVRYFPSQPVKAGMRVSYSGRTFRVQAASDPDESRTEQQMLCFEEQ